MLMTTKADFPDEDWVRVVRAPFVAGMAITLADPGGPIEAAKESMASIKAATNPPSREQLLSEIALDIQAQVQQHHNPVKGYRPAGTAPVGDQILQELTDVRGIVNEHATPEEAAAFGDWLVSTAEAAAEAAKEGGFMGFKAELVSERETQMIEKVRSAVS
jgi:hypothetical protein